MEAGEGGEQNVFLRGGGGVGGEGKGYGGDLGKGERGFWW